MAPVSRYSARRRLALRGPLGISVAATVATVVTVAWPSVALAGPPRLEPTDTDKPWGSSGDNQRGTGEASPAASAEPSASPDGNEISSADGDEPTGPAPGDPANAEDGAASDVAAPATSTTDDESAASEVEQAPAPTARAELPAPEKGAVGDPKHPFKVEGDLGKKERTASLTIYGMVVVNAAYNTGTPFPSQEAPIGAVKNSRNGDGLPSDGAFVITARQSRLGLNGKVQISDKVDATGKIETDFFGLHEDVGPGGVPQTGIRLRLAYLDVGGERWRFLAGQNWSVVTPRLPTSIGHMVIALHTFSGAVWNRLPQLAGVFRQPVSGGILDDAGIVVQLAAARSVSHDGFGARDCPSEVSNPNSPLRPNPSPGVTCRVARFDDPDQGSLAGFPVGQARVAFESKQFALGVAGHAGAEEWWAAALDGNGEVRTDEQRVATWMVSADLRIAPKWFWINAQGYYGRNINGMFSRQGVRANAWNVDATDPRAGLPRSFTALPGFGGWLEIGAPLGTDKVKLVTSAGADIGDRDGSLLGESKQVDGPSPGVPDGGVWAEFGIFAGLIYAPHPNFDMSLEYQRATTVYKRWEAAEAEVFNDFGFNDHISTNFRLKF